MVESNTETGTGNAFFVTKKKLKMPTPFSGKREDLQKFLQEVKIYLLVNSGIYTSDLDKVLFVLSYMTEGDANSWKEELYNTAEQKAAQDGSTILLRTYKELMDLIIKDFSPYDVPKDAIYEIKEMKMGNTSIEEHVAKFKMLVTKSKLEKNEAVVEYFRETLPIPLQKNFMTLKKPLTTLKNGTNGQSNFKTTLFTWRVPLPSPRIKEAMLLLLRTRSWMRKDHEGSILM